MGLDDYTAQDLIEELESRGIHLGICDANLGKVFNMTKDHFFENTTVDINIPNITETEMFIGMLIACYYEINGMTIKGVSQYAK